MFGWLKRDKAPLTGGRAVRREKTYSAESGYVYRYVYSGQRPARGGTEYVFEVSRLRRSFSPISVFLADAALEDWQAGHGRELSGPERYAVAKMALLQALDTAPSVQPEITVQPGDVASILALLGRD
jgi:hypothetical protein